MPRRIKKSKNSYDRYIAILRSWSCNISPDMREEPPREKLLDAMLCLFEALDAQNLKPPIRNLYGNRDWASIRTWLRPLHQAIRWQLIALEMPSPRFAASAAVPYVLTLATLRWIAVWLGDNTQGHARLMATIDRDLERMAAATQQIVRLGTR